VDWPDSAQILEAAHFATLPEPARRACLECLTWVQDSPELRRYLWHLYHVLFLDPGASVGDARAYPTLAHLGHPAALTGALLCLCAVPGMRARHAARSIPEDVTIATLRDLGLWMCDYRRQTGVWGFDHLRWMWRHLCGRLVRLGRLQFEIAVNPHGFHLFCRPDGPPVVLAGDGMTFRSDGHFADADGQRATSGVHVAAFATTAEGWWGERIDPVGHATGERVDLSRAVWTHELEPGGPVVAVHVPAGGDPTLGREPAASAAHRAAPFGREPAASAAHRAATLGREPAASAAHRAATGSGPFTAQACDESFAAAATFLRRHYPEHAYRAYTCTSWLLDPQLARYLPRTSNILRFQERFYLVPVPGAGPEQHIERVFGRGPHSLETLSRLPAARTTLGAALVRHMRLGGRWRMGGGLIPVG
jgi:hypothetical protein